MRRPPISTLALVSIGGLLALASPVEAAKSDTVLGFTDDPVRTVQAAPVVQGTSQVARIPLYWTGVRASGWGEIDAAVNAARASGQRLLLTVTGLQAPDLIEWSKFLTELHARYPDLWALQAWNEPNLENIGGLLSVEQTAAIVQAAHLALPGVQVIGPSVSPTVPGAARYQTNLYRLLPDEIGVGVNIFTYRRSTAVADVLAQYRQAKADGGAAGVYVTEVGFHGAYFPDQAANSAQAFGALRAEGASAVIFYRLLTDRALTANWELAGHFNVLNDDLTPTPILKAVQGALADTKAPKVHVGRVALNRRQRSVKIRFSAKDNRTAAKKISVSCTLDKKQPKPCSSPATYKRLSAGKHKFSLTARDQAGNPRTYKKKFRLKRP